MTDSTPTAVTVSDRMRELVEAYAERCYLDGYCKYRFDTDSRTIAAKDAVFRAVGWDETVIDQRGKRIQELEAKVHHPSRRWNFEAIDTGVRVCKGLHEKHEDCEWEYFIPHAAPADETRDVNNESSYSKKPADALIRPPQTRGEAMPEVIDGSLSDTADCSAFPNEGRCQHWRCITRERDRLQARVTLLADASERSYLQKEEMSFALARSESDRSRLLTALEEKEREHAEAREAWGLDYLAMVKHRDDLQSAAVLQKEELKQVRGLALELSQTLAKRCLADASAEALMDAAINPGEPLAWPGDQEWDDLVGTSQSSMRRRGWEEAGLDIEKVVRLLCDQYGSYKEHNVIPLRRSHIPSVNHE